LIGSVGKQNLVRVFIVCIAMSFRIAILLVLSVGSTANRVNSKIALDIERLAEKEEETFLNKSTEESDDKMKYGIGLPNKTALGWDTIMDSHMEEFVTFFLKAANAEGDVLSKTKFRSVVQANDCIRRTLEVSDRTLSGLPGWHFTYKEIDTDGDGSFPKDELVEVFQNRGALVMYAAEHYARTAFRGMKSKRGVVSKKQVKTYLQANQFLKQFLQIGVPRVDGTMCGWEDLWSLMGTEKYKTGRFTVEDLVSVFKFRTVNIFPGDCFPLGSHTILGFASPVEESSEVVKKEVPSTVEVEVPHVVNIAGNLVAQIKFTYEIQNALADRSPPRCRLLQGVFWKMDQNRKNRVTVDWVDASLLHLLDSNQKKEALDILRRIRNDDDPLQFSDLVNFKLESHEAAKCKLGYGGA
jgi:hypothetical protein